MQRENEYELNDILLKNMSIAMIDHEHKTVIHSIDFSKDGNYLVSCDDISLNIYDMQTGKKMKTLYNKATKLSRVIFTHSNQAVLCSTGIDHKILYWSIHDNEIIKVFEGHHDLIVCLEINPQNDIFLSSSKDQFFKLWDLKALDQSPIGIIDLSKKKVTPIGNFDPTGVIFAIAFAENTMTPTNQIKLYDMEKFSEGCFNSWSIESPEIKSMKFSNSGTHMLLATAENLLILIDAFDGALITKITGYTNENFLSIEASFTPDSRYVISGSEDGLIYIWDLSGKEITKLEGHVKPSLNVKFSPTNVVMASTCKNLIFWLPKEWGQQNWAK